MFYRCNSEGNLLSIMKDCRQYMARQDYDSALLRTEEGLSLIPSSECLKSNDKFHRSKVTLLQYKIRSHLALEEYKDALDASTYFTKCHTEKKYNSLAINFVYAAETAFDKYFKIQDANMLLRRAEQLFDENYKNNFERAVCLQSHVLDQILRVKEHPDVVRLMKQCEKLGNPQTVGRFEDYCIGKAKVGMELGSAEIGLEPSCHYKTFHRYEYENKTDSYTPIDFIPPKTIGNRKELSSLLLLPYPIASPKQLINFTNGTMIDSSHIMSMNNTIVNQIQDAWKGEKISRFMMYTLPSCGMRYFGLFLEKYFEATLHTLDYYHTRLPTRHKYYNKTLNIILVKDPLFWIQSMLVSRKIDFDVSKPFAPIWYFGKYFKFGLISYWNDFMRTYTEDFSSSNSLIIRSSDITFRLDFVETVLSPLFKRRVTKESIARNEVRRKDVNDEQGARQGDGFTLGTRTYYVNGTKVEYGKETKEFRAFGLNRFAGFSRGQLQIFANEIDKKCLKRLGYYHAYRYAFRVIGLSINK
eukprot:g2981.t1